VIPWINLGLHQGWTSQHRVHSKRQASVRQPPPEEVCRPNKKTCVLALNTLFLNGLMVESPA